MAVTAPVIDALERMAWLQAGQGVLSNFWKGDLVPRGPDWESGPDPQSCPSSSCGVMEAPLPTLLPAPWSTLPRFPRALQSQASFRVGFKHPPPLPPSWTRRAASSPQDPALARLLGGSWSPREASSRPHRVLQSERCRGKSAWGAHLLTTPRGAPSCEEAEQGPGTRLRATSGRGTGTPVHSPARQAPQPPGCPVPQAHPSRCPLCP